MKALTDTGFFHTETGGGCTAYEKPVANDAHLLMTIVDDAAAPQSMDDKVSVYLYDANGDQVMVISNDGLTVTEFITNYLAKA